MNSYIFEIDNTLLSPGQPIDSYFMRCFEQWLYKPAVASYLMKDVYLCTNSSYSDIYPRLGRKIVEGCKAVFACNGNSIWMNNKEVKNISWKPPLELVPFLEKCVFNSPFKTRSGFNIEHLPGMISFSIVGKTANIDDRDRYKDHDKNLKERRKIINELNSNFSGIFACSSGDTVIDICEVGKDKTQILQYFNEKNQITYIGDDKKLSDTIHSKFRNKLTKTHLITKWKETQDLIKSIQ